MAGRSSRFRRGDAARQAKYAASKIKQVEELWGNYGPLAEVWFDGGMPDPKAGFDVLPVLKKLQPRTMVYGGGNTPGETIRWMGSETGKTAYPCWSTGANPFDDNSGNPAGKDWCPGEADVNIQGGQWMWQPGSDNGLRSLNELMEIYYGSVGNNCNLLINAMPGPDGLVPEAQLRRFREFGNEIRRRFGKSLAQTAGEGSELELSLGKSQKIDHVMLMEEIIEGERVRRYVVEGKVGPSWQKIGGGSCIGHKRIERVTPVEVSAVRLRVLESIGKPLIRKLAVFDTTAPATAGRYDIAMAP
ncbi:MAG: alpha-L-fucosidase [Planctomycetota bacterium]|nr:alpha-L-fucosidase [Planctomycetota bacterium]